MLPSSLLRTSREVQAMEQPGAASRCPNDLTRGSLCEHVKLPKKSDRVANIFFANYEILASSTLSLNPGTSSYAKTLTLEFLYVISTDSKAY